MFDKFMKQFDPETFAESMICHCGGGGGGGGGGAPSATGRVNVGGSTQNPHTPGVSRSPVSDCAKGVALGAVGGAIAGSRGGVVGAGLGAAGGGIAGSGSCWGK